MAIEFKPQATWRGPGRPEVHIPSEIVDALEHTFETGEVAEDVADETDSATWEVIRMMRLHCQRRGLRLDFQFFDRPDGVTGLRFRMRRPRPYNRQVVTPGGRYRR